jgi:hypothetical protein
MHEPTYCQMNANLSTVAQCTPPAPTIRRVPSSPDDGRLRDAAVSWRIAPGEVFTRPDDRLS